MIEYLFEAIVSDRGLVIACDQPSRLISKLTKLRADNISKFRELKIVLSPRDPKGEVWIMKVKEELDL